MSPLFAKPTPPAVKRWASAFGIDGPLKRVKVALMPFQVGAELQALRWLGQVPSRTLRHAAYRSMGMSLGTGAVIHHGVEVRNAHKIEVGADSVVGFDVILDGRRGITIGRHVNISSQVAIWTLQHDHRAADFGVMGGAVTIGDRAWLSFRAIILPGLTIGDGAVVAAGAVVTEDVPAYAIVAGIPARVVGERTRELDYELGAVPSPWFV